LLVFAAVIFCVVSGDLSIPQKRTTGTCASGATFEVEGTTITFTPPADGLLQRCNPENAREITTVIIKEGFTKLGYGSLALGAFQDWWSLSSVTLPESLTTMEDNAFRSTSLTSFHVPKLLTKFDGSAFFNCSKLTKFTVDAGNEYISEENGVLFDKNKVTIKKYPAAKTDSKYTIPDGVHKIGAYSFQNCMNLNSVTLPDSAVLIEKMAFHNSGIKTIVIPASVTQIQQSAFVLDDNLYYVKYLGEKDPYDGTSTIFLSCPKLESVCVGSNYQSPKFCNMTISKDCPEPAPSSSSSLFPSAILAFVVFAFLLVF